MNLSNIPNLEAWWSLYSKDRSTLQLKGDRLVEIRDKSGNGHTMAPLAGTEGPTWANDAALGTDSHVIVGDSSVTLETAGQVLPATGEFHIFIAHKINAAAQNFILIAGDSGDPDSFVLYNTSSGRVIASRISPLAPRFDGLVNGDTWELYEVSLTAGQAPDCLRMYVNGTYIAPSLAGGTSDIVPAAGLKLWKSAGGAINGKSSVAELAVFQRSLNAQEQRDVREHFEKRWAPITITNTP